MDTHTHIHRGMQSTGDATRSLYANERVSARKLNAAYGVPGTRAFALTFFELSIADSGSTILTASQEGGNNICFSLRNP